MQVVGKNGVFEDVDSEDRSEGFEALPDPLSSVGVVFAGQLIDTGEPSSANTTMMAMDKADFVRDELLTAGRAGHDG
jgi:hypothetical protein